MDKYKSIFDAVTMALGVINQASNLPGVDLIPYVGTVGKVAKYAQAAIDLGQKELPYAEMLVNSFSGGLPTEEARAQLDADIEAKHAEIQGFTPTAETDEEQ